MSRLLASASAASAIAVAARRSASASLARVALASGTARALSSSSSSSSSAASASATPHPVSASDFSASDAALQSDAAFKAVYGKFSKPAGEDRVRAVVAALTKHKYDVKVVDDEKQAVAAIGALIPRGASYSSAGSTTLTQIAFGDYLKTRTDVRNIKGESIAAAAAGDTKKQAKLLGEGASADVFVTSVSAVDESGAFYGADLTGTRLNGWLLGGRLVVVAGTNKLVKDEAEANERLWKYQLPLESARVRVAFKVPGSAVQNHLAIRGPNPFGGPRVSFVLVKKALGF